MRLRTGPSGRFPERVRLAGQGLVLAAVVSGTSAFAVLHKSVELDVDGERTTVSAFGRTVADVLDAHGVAVGARDVVVPALDAAVASDAEIVVRHAREVVVEIDGTEQTVWTTAETVGEVLAELGLRDARTSVSRSASLGRDVVRLSTPKTVHVAVDGATADVASSAATVRDVLREAGVVLGEHDQVSVPLDAAAVEGLVVMVTRVETVVVTETVTQPFAVVREDDPGLAKGTEVVARRGREGTQVVTVESYQVGGAEVGRSLVAQAVVAAPVDELVRVGTREAPAVPTAPPVEPGTSRAIGHDMVLARGWSEDEWACLDALWSHESGWRVNAANTSSGAYGIPQALPGSKMASAGADWQTNPATQITWGLGYVSGRYGTPCGAWDHFERKGWY